MDDTQVDEKYTDGIWYDTYHGDCSSLTVVDGAKAIAYEDPDTGEVFMEMTLSKWNEDAKERLVKVPERAVTNPVEFATKARTQHRKTFDLDGTPAPDSEEFIAGITYAYNHTKVVPDD